MGLIIDWWDLSFVTVHKWAPLPLPLDLCVDPDVWLHEFTEVAIKKAVTKIRYPGREAFSNKQEDRLISHIMTSMVVPSGHYNRVRDRVEKVPPENYIYLYQSKLSNFLGEI